MRATSAPSRRACWTSTTARHCQKETCCRTCRTATRLDGRVYWDVSPTYGSSTRTIKEYDITTRTTTSQAVPVTRGKPNSAPRLSAAGITWTTTDNLTVGITADLPSIVAAATKSPAHSKTASIARTTLSTDGSAYAWFAGGRRIGWWDSGSPAPSYVTVPKSSAWSSLSFSPNEPPAVAGHFVFVDGHVIDMRTGAAADIASQTTVGGAIPEIYGGHNVGAFGYFEGSASHGVILGYAFAHSSGDWKSGPTEMLRLDTSKLPDLRC